MSTSLGAGPAFEDNMAADAARAGNYLATALRQLDARAIAAECVRQDGRWSVVVSAVVPLDVGPLDAEIVAVKLSASSDEGAIALDASSTPAFLIAESIARRPRSRLIGSERGLRFVVRCGVAGGAARFVADAVDDLVSVVGDIRRARNLADTDKRHSVEALGDEGLERIRADLATHEPTLDAAEQDDADFSFDLSTEPPRFIPGSDPLSRYNAERTPQ